MKKYFKYMYILLISLVIGIMPIKAETNEIKLNKTKMTLGIGYSEILKYTLQEGLNDSKISWHSSNTKVATIDSNGKITGITEGWTLITASINGSSATCEVTISSNYVPANGISLNETKLSILIGDTETLISTITPSNVTNKDVTWISSDNSIVKVDSNGTLTAEKIGTALITVFSQGHSASCEVTVVDTIPLQKITINKSTLTIKEKSSETLKITYTPSNATNKKVTWKSTDTNIVKVDSNGKITAVKPGSATIKVTSKDGGYVEICKVTVEAISKKVTSISLDKKELSIVAGEKTTIKANIKPTYAENKNVTWTSSDESIATVENGKITAISPGTVEIKVITEEGNKEAICKVTVTPPPIKSISFKETQQTVYIGSETTLLTIVEPVNSVLENPIWVSSDENIATVENGVVKALNIGETTITVSNEDKSITASITIKVINKPKEKLNITIEGYNLNFDPNIKNYTIQIGNEDKLKINTNLSDDKVTILGNQNLKSGSIIKIIVNDEKQETYVINITNKPDYTIYFIAAISVLLLINLIRIMLKNKKK